MTTQPRHPRSRWLREHLTKKPSPVNDHLFDDEQLHALDAADQSQVDQLRDPAQIAAARTFGPFNDMPDSPFYSVEDLSPAQTWERIAEHVVLATTVAAVHGAARRPITVETIRRLHEIIFLTTFPEHAGRLRQRNEEGEYGIVLGTAEQPIAKGERATAGARVGSRLEQICREFNETVVEQDQSDPIALDALVFTAVRLYAKVLSTHPFLDGTGRTAVTILQYFDAHQRALGTALRSDGKQSYIPLQALIVDKLTKGRFPEDD
jgi:fido (protein-threonine AMPylation protein)